MKKSFALIFIIVFAVGCAGIRTGVDDLMKEDAKNVAAMRELSRDIIKSWPMWSGFIQGYLGDDIKQLPQNSVESIVMLDSLCIDPDPHMVDSVRGFILGKMLRFHIDNITEGLKKVAPGLLAKLPAFML